MRKAVCVCVLDRSPLRTRRTFGGERFHFFVFLVGFQCIINAIFARAGEDTRIVSAVILCFPSELVSEYTSLPQAIQTLSYSGCLVCWCYGGQQ